MISANKAFYWFNKKYIDLLYLSIRLLMACPGTFEQKLVLSWIKLKFKPANTLCLQLNIEYLKEEEEVLYGITYNNIYLYLTYTQT